jgi:hypothetical protein
VYFNFLNLELRIRTYNTLRDSNATNATSNQTGAEGTNIFNGKLNSSDAAGLVGPTNFSISSPPYVVKRCDQVLLLPGKKLNLKDYCTKEDAFMTLSIYMANLFLTKDSNKLIESIPMDQMTTIPSPIPGAPGCTTFSSRFKSWAFCYESEAILGQVIEAYKEFMTCRKGNRPSPIAAVLGQHCNVDKLDFSETGPFGKQGPVYKSIIEEQRRQEELKRPFNSKTVNPYYNIAKVPGS